MTIEQLPTLNALLNFISAILLLIGYINIRKGRKESHRSFMIAALAVSVAFLISYTIYHLNIGSRPYPYHDWTRPLYFTILIPHVILAALMSPFIVWGVLNAVKGRFAMHKRIMRIIWPVWMFVSVTGVIVYVMLYRL
jgi:putative membrane protein